MPIYEYQCAACGQVVERWQKISEAPLTQCPVCGGTLHKLISSCAFHLKGSGWYVTDYAGKNAAVSAGDHHDGSKAGSEGGGKASGTSKAEASAAPKIK
ncbi:MAG: zinc ribbon domain-containing protein [Deltaproteobacteria bacterium]|jgi:putative FmdB family regulatory protein